MPGECSGDRGEKGWWWGSLGFRRRPILLVARAADKVEGLLPRTLASVCDAPW